MDTNTEAIVRLAWTGILDLDDDLLLPGGDERICVVREDADSVSFVQLLGQSILIGPNWTIDQAGSRPSPELAAITSLLKLCADHHPQAIGEATLAYLDDYVQLPGLDDATVTDDPAAVVDLEKLCAPDDVAEVGLAELTTQFVLISEADEPLAGAGFDIWGDIIAHQGVLTAQAVRRQGLGTTIAALATNAALDDGLVPQWRSRTDNLASRKLARRLGYREVGTQTTVLING